ncbi:hypothetical protein BG000_002246 [Podila horticola]|nr:hypothetical protein BG000_002246 [Podila horticola]
MAIQFLTKETSKLNDSFRNSECGPEAAEAMTREVRNFKLPSKNGRALIMGHYIDRTSRDAISKVMLEEIVFDTWFGGRAVLLGDDESSGRHAMHDAVALANWISAIDSPTHPNLKTIFKEYRDERRPIAKAAFESSQLYTKFLGKSAMSVFVRGTMKRFPLWLWKLMKAKNNRARPQVSFLPLIEDKPRLKPTHQRSIYKTLSIHQKRELDKGKNPIPV